MWYRMIVWESCVLDLGFLKFVCKWFYVLIVSMFFWIDCVVFCGFVCFWVCFSILDWG